MIELRTERLRLRRLTLEDGAFILRHVNEPSFIENIRDSGVRSLEDARRYLEDGPLTSYRQHGFGLLAIERLENPGAIGMCGLLKRPHLEAPDIGFALDPPHRGQGYATESCRAVLAWASGHGIPRILAITSPENTASQEVLKRIGMVREADRSLENGPVAVFSLDLSVHDNFNRTG